MATVKFLLQSKSEIANIYIRFSIDRKTILKRKSGFTINPKYWSETFAQPIQKSKETKELKSKLSKLSDFISDSYNDAVSKGVEFTGEWLQDQIDIFNNKKTIVELDDWKDNDMVKGALNTLKLISHTLKDFVEKPNTK